MQRNLPTWVLKEIIRLGWHGVKVSKREGINRYRMCLVREWCQGEQTWRLRFTRSKLYWNS